MSKKVPANPIQDNQYERFKSRLEENSGKFKDRNLTLFMLGVGTGYRAQDIVDLTIKDIRQALEDGEFVIQEKKQYNAWLTSINKNPNSKKKKPEPRKAPIKKKLYKILRDYIKNKKGSEYAFPSQKGNGNEHISEKSYSAILSKVGKSLGLKNISGHSMRKTYATKVWEKTKDLNEVRVALGHKSVEVTKSYLGISKQVVNNAAEIVDDFI